MAVSVRKMDRGYNEYAFAAAFAWQRCFVKPALHPCRECRERDCSTSIEVRDRSGVAAAGRNGQTRAGYGNE